MCRYLLVVVALVVLACAPVVAANLVPNGTFDDPFVLYWGLSYAEGQWDWWYGNDGSTYLPQSIVAPAYNTSWVSAPSAIMLGGHNVDPVTQRIAVGIAQDVAIEGSSTYALSAWLRCNGINEGQPFNGQNPNAYIKLSYNLGNGASWGDNIGVGLLGDAAPGWVKFSTTITTAPDTNVIRIGFLTVVPEGINTGGHWAYTQADDCVLEKIPEPSSMAALASLVLPFGLLLRRRSGR